MDFPNCRVALAAACEELARLTNSLRCLHYLEVEACLEVTSDSGPQLVQGFVLGAATPQRDPSVPCRLLSTAFLNLGQGAVVRLSENVAVRDSLAHHSAVFADGDWMVIDSPKVSLCRGVWVLELPNDSSFDRDSLAAFAARNAPTVEALFRRDLQETLGMLLTSGRELMATEPLDPLSAMLRAALNRPGIDGASLFATELGDDTQYGLVATFPRRLPAKRPVFSSDRRTATGAALALRADCVVHDPDEFRSRQGTGYDRQKLPPLWTDLENDEVGRSLLFAFHATDRDLKYALRLTRIRGQSGMLFDALDQLEARYTLPVLALIYESHQTDLSVSKTFFQVTHDIKLALTGIKSANSIVREYCRGEITAEERSERNLKLRHIDESVNGVVALLKRTMPPSRVNRASLSSTRSMRPYADLVRPVCETYRAKAEERGLRFEYHGGDQLGLIHGDPNDLRDVVANIVVNAIKYTFEGEAVMVAFERAQYGARIHFASKSLPISDDERQRIFDLRYRTKAAVDSGAPGDGLGLAICRDKLAPYRATISARTEGDVNVFTLHLPRGMFRRPAVPAASGVDT